MPTYTAEFFTDAEYATRAFKARSPRDALKQARAFYDERTEELIFKSYDDGQPVNEITVRDSDGNQVARWQDDDMRLRLAASDMLEALELSVDCLAIWRGSMTARPRSAPQRRRARPSPGRSPKRLQPRSLGPRDRSRPIRRR